MFLVLSGIIAGIVSGLGMGGGTILIIILTNLFGYTQHVAQASNVLFFIPTSIAALWVHIRDKDIESKIVMKMLPTAVLGGLVGAYISGLVEANQLQKYFGVFLLIVGMYEIAITVKNRFKEKRLKNNSLSTHILSLAYCICLS